MRAHSALLDVDRGTDGILRDITLRREAGDWALPSLALQVASIASGRPASSFTGSIRVNWRDHSKLPYASAADLIEGERSAERRVGKEGVRTCRFRWAPYR